MCVRQGVGGAGWRRGCDSGFPRFALPGPSSPPSLHRRPPPDPQVIATSRSPYHAAAAALGCAAYYSDADDFCEAHPDVVVLATSILSLEQVGDVVGWGACGGAPERACVDVVRRPVIPPCRIRL